MRLLALRMWNVRRFDGRGAAIENIGGQVSVLSAPNESGKSTALDAMNALLFLKHDSRATPVKSLRPHSGGNPLIELDIETPQGRFRIRKQYLTRPSARITDITTGRVTAQGADAETWIERLVRGGMRGPAGLLWVKQGVTGFDPAGKKEMEEDRQARDNIITSVAGEVETLTGGRRMSRVSAEVKRDLDALVIQSGKAKKGGPYDLALQEVDRLETRHADLLAKLDLLRGELRSRAEWRETLRQITDPDAIRSREENARTTAEALEAARTHARSLTEAGTREQLARTVLDDAEAKRAAHRTALDTATQTRDELTRAATALEAAQTRLAKLTHDHAALKSGLESLSTARSKAEKTHQDAVRITLAAQNRERHGAARDRLKQAQDARDRAESATAHAATIPVTEQDLASLRDETAKLHHLRAKSAAEAVRVNMAYDADPTARLRFRSADLPDRTDIPLTGPATLEIPGIGRLTVTPATSDTAAETLQAAETRLAADLHRLGAGDLAEAETLFARKTSALNDARIALSELGAHAPDGIDSLRQEVTRLAALTSDADTAAIDPETAEAAVQAARTALKEAEAKIEASRTTLEAARQEAFGLEAEVRTLTDRLTSLDRDLGPAEVRADRLAALEKTCAERARDHAALAEATRRLADTAPDLAAIEAAATRAASVRDNADAKRRQAETELASLDGRISARADEGLEEACQETGGMLDAARLHLAGIEREIAVLSRLHRALDTARAAAAERYLSPVITELKPLLSMLLGTAAISFDETTLLPTTMERDTVPEDVAILSGGMREQLAILTRLAFARLLARDGRHIPVILDDPLVFTDDARIEAMFNVLHRAASDLQILVFTCHGTVFEKLGGTDLAFADWSPPD